MNTFAYVFQYIIPGEVRRKCSICDQHQAVPGQPAGPQRGGGRDVPASRGVRQRQNSYSKS